MHGADLLEVVPDRTGRQRSHVEHEPDQTRRADEHDDNGREGSRAIGPGRTIGKPTSEEVAHQLAQTDSQEDRNEEQQQVDAHLLQDVRRPVRHGHDG